MPVDHARLAGLDVRQRFSRSPLERRLEFLIGGDDVERRRFGRVSGRRNECARDNEPWRSQEPMGVKGDGVVRFMATVLLLDIDSGLKALPDAAVVPSLQHGAPGRSRTIPRTRSVIAGEL